jgi:hypothetical protein
MTMEQLAFMWVLPFTTFEPSAKVWWFFPTFLTDENLLTLQDQNVSYPPKRDRPHPQPNGSDLPGRFFLEPDLGVCCIMCLGPLMQKKKRSRALLRAKFNGDKRIALGAHDTFYYQCVQSKEEFYSLTTKFFQWISTGPLLQPPTVMPHPNLHITTSAYEQGRESATSSDEPLSLPTDPPQEQSQLRQRITKHSLLQFHSLTLM